MVRTAALDWAQLFLIQEAEQSEYVGKKTDIYGSRTIVGLRTC